MKIVSKFIGTAAVLVLVPKLALATGSIMFSTNGELSSC